MKAKDYRAEAWRKLKGKWGTVALIAFLESLIVGVCSGLSWLGVGAVALLLVTGPFTLGLTIVSLNVARMKEVAVGQLFEGFRDFGRAFLVYLLNGIFVFLWSLLLVIPGIVKAFSYSMSYYVLADNPQLTANEARKRSMELMSGNKWRLFCLLFSFIGWWLLCIVTLGILSFWVAPYCRAAMAEFYESLLPKQALSSEPVTPQN